MYVYESIPVYWCNGIIKNIDILDDRLSKGWKIERVDQLRDRYNPVLMYIVEKEKNNA